MRKLNVFAIAASVVTLTALPVSLKWSQEDVSLSVDRADARVGRPATATSVAGVHRRAHRRAYRGAVYGGAAAAGAYGVGSSYAGYRYPGYRYGYADSSAYSSYGSPGFGFLNVLFPFFGNPTYGASAYQYPTYGYAGGTSYGYPRYTYAGDGYPRYAYPGYRAARRVAIHRARWQ